MPSAWAGFSTHLVPNSQYSLSLRERYFCSQFTDVNVQAEKREMSYQGAESKWESVLIFLLYWVAKPMPTHSGITDRGAFLPWSSQVEWRLGQLMGWDGVCFCHCKPCELGQVISHLRLCFSICIMRVSIETPLGGAGHSHEGSVIVTILATTVLGWNLCSCNGCSLRSQLLGWHWGQKSCCLKESLPSGQGSLWIGITPSYLQAGWESGCIFLLVWSFVPFLDPKGQQTLRIVCNGCVL